MSNIDYSSVINNAITYFNDTQDALSSLDAKRLDGITVLPLSSASYIPASEFSSIITNQLQLKASESYDISAVQTLSGGYYSIDKDFSAVKTARVKQGTLLDLTGAYNSDTTIYTISGGVSDSGWVPLTNQTLSINHATYTISGGSISVNTSGYAQAGEIVENITEGSATILPTATITSSILQDSGTTGDYEIDIDPTSSISTFSAGYFGSSDSIAISSPSTIKKYVKASTFTTEANSAGTTATNTLTPAQMLSISTGYSNTAKVIKVNSDGTALAENILSGKTAWVNNSNIVGSMTNRSSASAIAIDSSNFSGTSLIDLSYIIPQGYYDGATSISGSYSIGSATLTAIEPTLAQYDGDTELESTNNIISKTAPAEGISYYHFNISSNANVSTGYIASGTASSDSTVYYLPKATFSYITDSNSNQIISCSQPGYITTGDFAVTGTLDFAAITLTPTASSGSIFLSTVPAGEYYTINANHSITSAGYVNSETTFTDETKYLLKGSLSTLTELPEGTTEDSNKVAYAGYVKVKSGYYETDAYIGADISAGSIKNTNNSLTISSLSVSTTADGNGNYPVTGTTSISITPEVVSAGFISETVGTKSSATITGNISATVPGTNLVAGIGSAALTINSTSAVSAGEKALLSSSASGTYVIVNSTGSGNVSVETAGYIQTGSATSSSVTATGYIPALVSPAITVSSSSVSFLVGTATTYDETGVMTAGSKNNSETTSVTESEVSQTDNKYVIGDISVNKVNGTASASIQTDSTGSTVDSYVQSLYKCLIGADYTPRAAD